MPSLIVFGLAKEEAFQSFPNFKLLRLLKEDGLYKAFDATRSRHLATLPQDVIAVVYRTANGTADLVSALSPIVEASRISDWAKSHGLDVPVIEHSLATAQLLNLVGAQLQETAKWGSELMQQLAELRKLHEELQNSYASLRNYLYDEGLNLPKPTLVAGPESGITTPADSAEIVQVIPSDLKYLCGVAIHVATEVSASASGVLEAELVGLDDDTIHYAWEIDYSDLREGWVTLAFEQAGRYLQASVALKLSLVTDAGVGPAFSFGQLQPRPDKAAVIDDVVQTRSLALKLWKSVPGARVNFTTSMIPESSVSPLQVDQVDVAIHAGLDVADLETHNDLGFTVIAVKPDQSAILVHPTGDVPTIAKLPGGCPPGTDKIIARIRTDDPRAGPVQYAVAVSEEDSISVEEVDSLLASLNSGWFTMPSSVDGVITLDLDYPAPGPLNLFLMTKLPPNASPHFCQAQFRRISLKGEFQ